MIELVDMLKSPLTEDELAKMLPEESSEPDAYTGLLTLYTQRNTDALVKCKLLLLFDHIQ